METGDYETNTLLFNNISSISYQTYNISTTTTYPSLLVCKEVENTLRRADHIVHFDPSRRIIWQFELHRLHGHGSGNLTLGTAAEIHGVTLVPVDSGAFEPIGLLKPRSLGTLGGNTQSTNLGTGVNSQDSQRLANAAGLPWSPLEREFRSSALSFDESKSQAAITTKDAYENFISAILGTLFTGLVSRLGAIPLDSWSLVLFPDPEDQTVSQDPVTGTFQAYLTTAGCLVVSLTVQPGFQFTPLDEVLEENAPMAETDIIAAPFGVAGKCYGISDGVFPGLDFGFAQTPDTQIWRKQESKNALWRQACTRLFQLQDIPLSFITSCRWVNLQIARPKPTDSKVDGKRTPATKPFTSVSWPSSLCFRRLPACLRRTNRLSPENLLIGHEESYDPLGLARSWFQDAEHRSDMLLKRKKDREASPSNDIIAENETRLQPPSGQSPLNLHRSANAAAAGAMYPTPPDALHNLNGVTPSMDINTINSPAHAGAVPAVSDADTSMANIPVISADSYGWDAGETKRDRPDNGFPLSTDNLFEDMGGDMFNDGELTDADFNFFDDQPGDSTLDLGEMPVIPNKVDMSEQLVPTIQHRSHDEFGPETLPQRVNAEINQEVAEPEFTKPELRHARSSLVEDDRSRARNEKSSATKREPSPFNSDAVFKRIRARLNQSTGTGVCFPPPMRRNTFDKLDVGSAVPSLNDKYTSGGIYSFQWSPTREEFRAGTSLPPTTEYLLHHGKNKKALTTNPHMQVALIGRITSGLDAGSVGLSPENADDSGSDADDLSDSFDLSELRLEGGGGISPMKSSMRRGQRDDDSISQAVSFRDLELPDESDPSFVQELPRLSRFYGSKLSLAKVLSTPEPLPQQLSLPKDDMIAVAQILTEQAASGVLNISGRANADNCESAVSSTQASRREIATISRRWMDALQEILPCGLADPNDSQLRDFGEIQDAPLLGQHGRPQLQPRPVPGRDYAAELLKSTIFPISAPHLCVRRVDSGLSVLPSAIEFWELLGLGPFEGPKDINAACIFPDWAGMSDNICAFFDEVKSGYESLKLGSFNPLPTTGDINGGLVPYEVDKISVTPGWNYPRISSSLAERVEALCQALLGAPEPDGNVVVFYVYSPGNPGSIVDACTSFHQLTTAYTEYQVERGMPSRAPLVLQLVPLGNLASPTSVVIPSARELARTCIEMYDRCSLPGQDTPSPAIVLEKQGPRLIDFNLKSTPSESLMHENSCIHVTYAKSIDGRWITASWTDITGTQQMTASYCLGRKGRSPVSSFSNVANEIWETTHEILSTWKVQWRVVITRCGVMEPQESEFWTSLAITESKAKINLVLLAVDTTPFLQLIPPPIRISGSVWTTFYTTPVSTPQPSTMSPDPSGNPTTPVKDGGAATPTTPGDNANPNAPEAETDGALVDICDQTWGAVLGHRLNNSTFITDLNPALNSGYLVKRGGPRIEDPPVLMEINIIHSDIANPRSNEILLREMMQHFRALGTLARARGITDQADVRPLHIAAAEKAVNALYLLM